MTTNNSSFCSMVHIISVECISINEFTISIIGLDMACILQKNVCLKCLRYRVDLKSVHLLSVNAPMILKVYIR